MKSIFPVAFIILFPVVTLGVEKQSPSPSDELALESPWAFNLTLYTWLAGVSGNFNAGPISQSVDASFIDIVDKSRRFPLGFMGRAEAHYDRFGFYLDGNYLDIKLEPKFEQFSSGIDSQLGVMDYGVSYRLLGPTAAEVSRRAGQKDNHWLEVYTGGRTLWLGNSVDLTGPNGGQRTLSVSKSFTSPLIGGRFMVSFMTDWFLLMDGNVGGFGADNVDITASGLGAIGYRMSVFDFPLSVQAGYKALHYEVKSGGGLLNINTHATLNGPFVGFTGYW